MMAQAVESSEGLEKPEWATWNENPSPEELQIEIAKCMKSPAYFLSTYCSISAASSGPPDGDDDDFDPTEAGGGWIRFELWPSQLKPLKVMHTKRKSAHLKARQIGLTWLALGEVLWMKVFLVGVTAMLFSRGDREAMDLMRRLKGMFQRLPWWLIPEGSFTAKGKLVGSAGHSWTLPNGNRTMAFPSTAGDSYSASVAVIDEADLVHDLDRLLSSVKPTVDNGGKLILVSKSNKKEPTSPFKRIFRAAMQGRNGFTPVFLPWWSHPRRTQAWYQDQVDESVSRTFSMDYMHGEYPEDWESAIAPNQLDKRFPLSVLKPVFAEAEDLRDFDRKTPVVRWKNPKWDENQKDSKEPEWLETVCPTISGLRIYKLPQAGGSVTMGVDPAMGLPASDDSAIVITDDKTGEEVASLRGKIDPRLTGRYSAELCNFYRSLPSSKCTVVIERNNHGAAAIGWWRDCVDRDNFDAGLWLGRDRNPGWVQTTQMKEIMYHRASDRVSRKECIIHSQNVFDEIASVEANGTNALNAPEGQHDDSAVAWALSLAVGSMKRKLNWMELKLT